MCATPPLAYPPTPMRILHTSDWHLGQHFMGKSHQAEHQALIDWLLIQVEAHAVDAVLMRITDIFLAFPALVLALAIAGALGPALTTAMLAVSVVWWPWYARLTRGQVIARKQELYVEAARAAGCTDRVILQRHVLPNSWTPIVVQSTLDMGAALITTASLGYIGMGAQPPSAEWGAMLSQARDYFLNAWWLTFFPGLAIFLSVLIFTAAGELLREATTR